MFTLFTQVDGTLLNWSFTYMYVLTQVLDNHPFASDGVTSFACYAAYDSF